MASVASVRPPARSTRHAVLRHGRYVPRVEDLLGRDIDVLVLATSILSFEKVVSSLPQSLLKNVLVLDVLSVKT